MGRKTTRDDLDTSLLQHLPGTTITETICNDAVRGCSHPRRPARFPPPRRVRLPRMKGKWVTTCPSMLCSRGGLEAPDFPESTTMSQISHHSHSWWNGHEPRLSMAPPEQRAAIGKPVPREQRQARRFAQWTYLPALDISRIGPVAELHHQDPPFPDQSVGCLIVEYSARPACCPFLRPGEHYQPPPQT